MKAFDVDPGIRWLFWMVHPDDEVFVSAWIRRLIVAGCQVDIGWTHQTPVRRKEAHASAELLGVPEERRHFLDARDGQVAEQMPDLLPALKERIASIGPDRVVTTAFEQGHLDHDATNLMVNYSFSGPVFEVPLYHAYITRWMRLGEFADPLTQELLELSIDDASLKRAILDTYRSQTLRHVFRIVDFSHIFSGGRRLFRWERLRLQTHMDFAVPNLPEPLRGRVGASAPWSRWLKALSAIESACGAGTFNQRAGMAEW